MPMVFKKEQLDLARGEEVGRGRISLCSRRGEEQDISHHGKRQLLLGVRWPGQSCSVL